MSLSTPSDDPTQLVRDAVTRGVEATSGQRPGRPSDHALEVNRIGETLRKVTDERSLLTEVASADLTTNDGVRTAMLDPYLTNGEVNTVLAEGTPQERVASCQTQLDALDQRPEVLEAVERYAALPESAESQEFTRGSLDDLMDEALRGEGLPTLSEARALTQGRMRDISTDRQEVSPDRRALLDQAESAYTHSLALEDRARAAFSEHWEPYREAARSELHIGDVTNVVYLLPSNRDESRHVLVDEDGAFSWAKEHRIVPLSLESASTRLGIHPRDMQQAAAAAQRGIRESAPLAEQALSAGQQAEQLHDEAQQLPLTPGEAYDEALHEGMRRAEGFGVYNSHTFGEGVSPEVAPRFSDRGEQATAEVADLLALDSIDRPEHLRGEHDLTFQAVADLTAAPWDQSAQRRGVERKVNARLTQMGLSPMNERMRTHHDPAAVRRLKADVREVASHPRGMRMPTLRDAINHHAATLAKSTPTRSEKDTRSHTQSR